MKNVKYRFNTYEIDSNGNPIYLETPPITLMEQTDTYNTKAIVINSGSWTGTSAPYTYTITANTIGYNDSSIIPSVEIYLRTGSSASSYSYELVGDTPKINSDGSITVQSNSKNITVVVVVRGYIQP